MKIKIIGKNHREGVSSKTGRAYNINIVHYIGTAKDVEGQAAMTMTLDGAEYPYATLVIGGDYIADYDGSGSLLTLTPIGKDATAGNK